MVLWCIIRPSQLILGTRESRMAPASRVALAVGRAVHQKRSVALREPAKQTTHNVRSRMRCATVSYRAFLALWIAQRHHHRVPVGEPEPFLGACAGAVAVAERDGPVGCDFARALCGVQAEHAAFLPCIIPASAHRPIHLNARSACTSHTI